MTDASSVIGVVIVTYDSSALIDACLDALPAAADDRPLDVVVVDNGSTDDVVARAEAHPIGATVIDTGRNDGYAAGINVGLAALPTAHAVLVLNPDCRLDPGALARLADELDATGAAIVAPLIHEPDGTVAWSIHRNPTLARAIGNACLGTRRAGRHSHFGEQETRPEAYSYAHDVDWASGAVLLISRACLDDVGDWDERFFLYSEETDFQIRATRAGHVVRFVPDATSTHDGGDAPVSGRLWALLAANRVRLYRKHHGPFAAAVYRLVVIGTEAVRVLRGREPSRAALAALLSPRRRRALYPTEAT